MSVVWLFYARCLRGGHEAPAVTMSLTGADCHCRSLFTIGACGPERSAPKNSKEKSLRQAISLLFQARNGADISIIQNLNTISKFLPSSYIVHTRQSSQRVRSYVPYIPCRIHVYSKEEISHCLDKRFLITGNVLKIAFVGDSMVRNLMEKMVVDLKEVLNLTVAGDTGVDLDVVFLNDKMRHMFPVEGKGLELKLHWSAELGKNSSNVFDRVVYQGARDILVDWSEKIDNPKFIHEVPNIIYFDNGMWSSSMRPEIVALDSVYSDYKDLFPVLKKLASNSLLLLRTQTPMKEYLAKLTMPNGALDLMNNIGWFALNNSGVWIWDTPTPYYLREYNDCYSIWRAMRNASPPSWACMDYQHPSRMAEAVADNMIWNFVCNKIMEISQDHCCS